MTRRECLRCGRNSYYDGKCYADVQQGRSIRYYAHCDWAKPIKRHIMNKKQLTVEDLEALDFFLYVVKNNKSGCITFTRMPKEKYEEVLRRFYATRTKGSLD